MSTAPPLPRFSPETTMSHELTSSLTNEERRQIDESLLSGVVSRASVLSLLYALAFGAYSFTSYEFLHQFEPDLTLFANLWPRLLFNSLPFLALAFYFKNHQDKVLFKCWLWTIGMPCIFVAACCIHVWPLMWRGKPEVYSYVHAANLFIIATSFIVVSPPPRLIFAQVGVFLILFVAPISYLFMRLHQHQLLLVTMGDFAISYLVSIYSAYMVYKLRLKIAKLDLSVRKAVSPFLGSALAQAIYTQRSDLLKNRKAQGIIVKMDIRGYTDFYKKNDPEFVRRFMSSYHSIVSRFVGQTNGYWHKSIGDGHLASYGVMDSESPDLTGIPGIEGDVEAATKRKKKSYFDNALKAVTSVAYQFERLKEQFDVKDDLSLGIAIAFGEVEVRVQGDEVHKQELDIDGEVILRCSRLEGYSKCIQKEGQISHSLLVVSPELIECTDPRMFRTWITTAPELQVRSYPEIRSVVYHSFRDLDERRANVLKFRAS